MSCEKRIVCDFCKATTEIKSVHFPEDLYDLMIKYNVQQLFWLCETCKLKKDQCMLHCLNISKEIQELKQNIFTMTKEVEKLNQHENLNGVTTDIDSGIDMVCTVTPDTSELYTPSKSISVSSPISVTSPVVEVKNSEDTAILKDIMVTEIKVDPEMRKRNVEIILHFVNELISVLKSNNPIFSALFQRIHHTGSSFDGLRITDANEFDIDMVLKFPFKEYQKVEHLNSKPSFAIYKLNDGWKNCHTRRGWDDAEFYAQLGKHFIEENYVMPAKVRYWMQSITAKVDLSKIVIQNVQKITTSASGPAKTFKFQTTFGYEISLDLVPVIEFRHPEWPENAEKSVVGSFSISEDHCFWFLVPKEYGGTSREEKVTIADKHHMWQVHFPAIEKMIIHDHGCVKPIIKLLKLLRDKQGWKVLSSYYLKTVVMWVVIHHKQPSYWKEDLMKERLIEVLKCLLGFLDNRNIPHILFPNYNLLEKASEQHVINMFHRLKKIISAIGNDFTKVKIYFARPVK